MTEEVENSEGQNPHEVPDISGFDELLYSLASALATKRSKDAVARIIETYAEDFRAHRRRAVWVTVGWWTFTLLVMVGIGVAARLELISKETTAALLGAVIGSLFRRNN